MRSASSQQPSAMSSSLLLALTACCCMLVLPAVGVRIPFSVHKTNESRTKLHRLAQADDSEQLTSLDNFQYVGLLEVGTPRQQISVVFDTGSDITWVACGCSTAACKKMTQFYPGKSSTQAPKKPRKTAFIEYADRSYAIGYYFTDVVCLASFCSSKLQTTACMNRVSGQFSKQSSGLIGLSPDSLPYSVLSQMFNQNTCANKIIGISLGVYGTKDQGEISVCETDPTHYQAPISWSNNHNGSFWIANVDLISDGYKASGVNVIIDTGSTAMYVPPQIYKKVGLNQISDDVQVLGGFHTNNAFLCSKAKTFKTLGVRVGTQMFDIKAEDLVLDLGNNYCELAIYSTNSNFLLGDSFLRKVYTVYDFENKRIGFAKSVYAS